MSDIREALFWL